MITVLRNNRASAIPYAVAITLSLLIILCGAFEYIRLVIISTGIRDALQSAVISSVVANYDDAYSALREGYSGGYVLSDSDWQEQLDYGDIYGRLANTLGLIHENGLYIKRLHDGHMEFSLSGLMVKIINPPFAPGSLQQNLTVESMIIAEIPINFLNKTLPPIRLNLKVLGGYSPKF